MNTKKTAEESVINHEKMIELIDHFQLSTQFFYWLAQDDVNNHILLEKVHEEIYERIGEYIIDGIKVFSGGGQFALNKINPHFRQRVTSEKELFYSLIPELAKLEKKKSAEVKTELNYTVISQFFYQGQLCGSCWEIYELPQIIKIFNLRKKGIPIS